VVKKEPAHELTNRGAGFYFLLIAVRVSSQPVLL
jgi:hypothetical protein